MRLLEHTKEGDVIGCLTFVLSMAVTVKKVFIKPRNHTYPYECEIELPHVKLRAFS